mmetsp:Transcript_21276/g.67971  ORF Transcript_21276/g.67971 Transcript_21276/m.67971 type:complete len:309 (-) Transcript_21276:406-1332(-)
MANDAAGAQAAHTSRRRRAEPHRRACHVTECARRARDHRASHTTAVAVLQLGRARAGGAALDLLQSAPVPLSLFDHRLPLAGHSDRGVARAARPWYAARGASPRLRLARRAGRLHLRLRGCRTRGGAARGLPLGAHQPRRLLLQFGARQNLHVEPRPESGGDGDDHAAHLAADLVRLVSSLRAAGRRALHAPNACRPRGAHHRRSLRHRCPRRRAGTRLCAVLQDRVGHRGDGRREREQDARHPAEHLTLRRSHDAHAGRGDGVVSRRRLQLLAHRAAAGRGGQAKGRVARRSLSRKVLPGAKRSCQG